MKISNPLLLFSRADRNKNKGDFSSQETHMENYGSTIFRSLLKNKLSVSVIAIAMAFGVVAPSYATIDNTVTVTGTAPGGVADAVTDSATETVDVEDDAPGVTVGKTGAITTDGDGDGLADEGDVITYTYTIENTGNTTLESVDVTDTHDGSGTLATPTFSSWTNQASSPAAATTDTSITMLPDAIAVFTTTYTVTAADILANGGGATPDGSLSNSAVINAEYNDGTNPPTPVPSPPSVVDVPLDAPQSLNVTKVAYEGGLGGTVAAADRPAGTVITYVYTITNDGSVPISDISVVDTHKGVVGALTPAFSSFTTNNGDGVGTLSSNTGNTIDVLYPGDVAVYTVDYTITQTDVDTLQ